MSLSFGESNFLESVDMCANHSAEKKWDFMSDTQILLACQNWKRRYISNNHAAMTSLSGGEPVALWAHRIGHRYKNHTPKSKMCCLQNLTKKKNAVTIILSKRF